MIAVVVVLGFAVGVALGALGGGGSILTVPALVYAVGLDPVAATTGSLVVVGVTTLVGSLAHLRAGRVRLLHGVVFGLLGVGGAVVGSLLSASVPPGVLLVAFSALMLVVAALMTRRRRAAARTDGAARPAEERTRPTAPVGLRPLRCDCRQVGVLLLSATAVGVLTGFFGVGGGFAVVPALVLVLRLPMPVAVGTSQVVIAINSASALTSRIGQDLAVPWGVVAGFAVVAVVGSLIGARLTSRVRPEVLSRAFTVLLVVVAAYTGVRSVAALA
ncbi:sulfite exporter TauE/SafE family protein [Actinotalea sp. AC32]|nr:sulfite exporter TauE/SafE family protein [Actinotalea sp. AC32]